MLLGRKAMTNLDSIFKSRNIKKRKKSGDITWPTEVCTVKAMVFLVVIHECESWTIKKAEHQRVNAFKLWCWRRLLRVPWTIISSSQSVLKEINPEYSLEGLVLKLKLQYFGHLAPNEWGADSLEKILMLGKTEGKRRRGQQRMRWLNNITDWMDMSFNKLREIVKDREAWLLRFMRLQRSRTRLSDWTTTRLRLRFSLSSFAYGCTVSSLFFEKALLQGPLITELF